MTRVGCDRGRLLRLRAYARSSFFIGPGGVLAGSGILGLALLLSSSLAPLSAQTSGAAFEQAANRNANQLLTEGNRIFRFDTFGSEAFWGGQLKLHQAVEGQTLGGIGSGLSPKKALELGLKIDMAAVPPNVAAAIKAGKVESQRAGQYPAAPQGERGGRTDRLFRPGRQEPAIDRDSVRALPLHRGRCLHARHRAASGRVAQSRP